ncbi:MAG: helix-turn-helix domain-containing protein, partial [Balneolaceae bacterium]
HIQELMEIRDWTQQDLADVLGVSTKHVNKLLNDEQPITLNMAKLLGEAFELSPQFWINLDTNYRLQLEDETEEEKDVDIRSKIYQYMPINEMCRKEWFEKPKTTDELEDIVCDFWGTEFLNFDRMAEIPELNYRKSDAYENFNPYAANCWYQMAKNAASRQKISEYNKSALVQVAKDLHSYTRKENGVADAIKKVNEAGVKFLVLSHLQKTYIDGASFIHNSSPVIVYTARYKRNDNFWFTLAHEIAHVLKHLKKEGDHFLDDFSKSKEAVNDKEKEANDLASKYLKHNEILDFFDNNLTYITQEQVEECAKTVDVDTAIIMGALAHHKQISYKYLHLFTVDVRKQIPMDFYIENKER